MAITAVKGDPTKTGSSFMPELQDALDRATAGVFYIKDRGAVGNGVADDSTAINDTIVAANAAGGGIVYIPEGDFLCDAQINPLSNTYLVGAGRGTSVIRRGATLTTQLITPLTAISRWGLSDLTIDGNLGVTTNTVAAEVMDIVGGSFMTAERLEFINIVTICFYMLGSHNRILHSDFFGAGATVTPGYQYGVHNCTPQSEDLLVEDCKFFSLRGAGVFIGGKGTTVTKCYFEDNQFDCVPGGGQVVVDSTFAASGLPTDVVIDDNRFGPVTNPEGVHAGELNAPCTFTNNDVNKQIQAGLKIQAGGISSLFDGKKYIIKGNKIRNTSPSGVGAVGSGDGAAIVISGAVRGVSLIGNVCWDDQTVKTQSYGIFIDALAKEIEAIGNICNDNRFGGILNDASAEPTVVLIGNTPDDADNHGNIKARSVTASGSIQAGTGLASVNASSTSNQRLTLQNSVGLSYLETGSDGRTYLANIGTSGTPDVAIGHLGASGDGNIFLQTNNTTRLTVAGATGFIGIGMTPANILDITQTQNATSTVKIINSDTGITAQARFLAASNTGAVSIAAHGSGRTATRYGTALGGFGELIAGTGSGLMIGTGTANTPVIIGSNSAEVARFTSSGVSIAGLTSGRIPVIGASGLIGDDADLTFSVDTLTSTKLVGSTSVSTPSLIAAANLTAEPVGDWIFNAGGKDILPSLNYDQNLGALSKKYLTLHAAELWVETLVAQDTIATIGGRILVGPTTVLTSDLAAAATSIIVKHNQMVSGDRVYMEANGKVEFMAITSAPSGSGPYTYTVTRNLDGTGANDWFAGDAVFNTGTTGNGFIDIYSVRGVKAASQAGPTIVGNVRTGTTFNAWAEHWAIGNLNGLYGYSSTTYGVGFGEYIAGTPHITIDATNGYRIFSGLSTVIGQWDNAGAITVGEVAASKSNILISSGALQIRNNTTVLAQWASTGDITIGEVAASKSNTLISAGALSMRLNTTNLFNIDTSGNVTLGSVATDQGNAFWNNSNKRLEFRGSTSGTVVQAYIDTTGAFTSGGGNVIVDSNGIQIVSSSSFSAARAITNSASAGGTALSHFYDANGASDHTTNLLSNSIASKDSALNLWAFAPTGQDAFVDLQSFVNGVSKAEIELSSAGVKINSGGSSQLWFNASGQTVIESTAPTLILTDTTASAKSLTVAVDSNLAQFRESAGASGSLMVLDLANNRMGLGTASPSQKLHIESGGVLIQNSGTAGFQIKNTSASFANAVTVGSVGNPNFLANWTLANTQDDGSKASWGVRLRPDTDQFNVLRSPAGSSTLVELLIVNAGGSLVVGPAGALAQSATDGDLHVPSCAGAPSGTPNGFTGKIPMRFDSTNNKLEAFLSGTWKSVTFT